MFKASERQRVGKQMGINKNKISNGNYDARERSAGAEAIDEQKCHSVGMIEITAENSNEIYRPERGANNDRVHLQCVAQTSAQANACFRSQNDVRRERISNYANYIRNAKMCYNY